MIICFNFLRNKNYVHKISSRNSTLLYKFHIKIYLESFVSIYNLYHLFGIIYKSIFLNFNITLNYWFISKTIFIRGNFIWKCPLGDPDIPVVRHRFSFFSVLTIMEITSCIFVLKYFSCSNSLVPLPFLLRHYIRRYNQMGKS